MTRSSDCWGRSAVSSTSTSTSTTFASAWALLDADVAMVVDFEASWDQFLSRLRTQRYDSEPEAVRAMAVTARTLDLTVQFVSRAGDVLVTL